MLNLLLLNLFTLVTCNEPWKNSGINCYGDSNHGVWLYTERDFQGHEFQICPAVFDCISYQMTENFNDHVLSARWKFSGYNKGCLCFYEHINCQGNRYCLPEILSWERQPYDFGKDGFSKIVSSVGRGGMNDQNCYPESERDISAVRRRVPFKH